VTSKVKLREAFDLRVQIFKLLEIGFSPGFRANIANRFFKVSVVLLLRYELFGTALFFFIALICFVIRENPRKYGVLSQVIERSARKQV